MSSRKTLTSAADTDFLFGSITWMIVNLHHYSSGLPENVHKFRETEKT